jgi:hypothetical protein
MMACWKLANKEMVDRKTGSNKVVVTPPILDGLLLGTATLSRLPFSAKYTATRPFAFSLL